MKLLLTFFDCHCKPFRHYVAQTSKPSTLADLVKFSGADCERYKGAKKEGKVIWSKSVPSKDIAKIFETKYPASGIQHKRHIC